MTTTKEERDELHNGIRTYWGSEGERLRYILECLLEERNELSARAEKAEVDLASLKARVDELEKMRCPDCSAIAPENEKDWPDTECALCALRERIAELEAEKKAIHQAVYPCGCITCVCENSVQCGGCGAHSCGQPGTLVDHVPPKAHAFDVIEENGLDVALFENPTKWIVVNALDNVGSGPTLLEAVSAWERRSERAFDGQAENGPPSACQG